jgi:hypothetical protein
MNGNLHPKMGAYSAYRKDGATSRLILAARMGDWRIANPGASFFSPRTPAGLGENGWIEEFPSPSKEREG